MVGRYVLPSAFGPLIFELTADTAPMVLDVNLSDLPLREAAAQYGIRDLWKRKNIGIVSRDAKFSLAMERHQAFLWLLRPLA